MKKIALMFVFLSVCLFSDAQKFLRYHMNNNTYNGFHIENIESIIHDYRNGVATTIVQTSIKNHDIYIDDIDSISIEDINLTSGNISQYRIYEFNYNEGDIKKIYVDNRASLFASHNGDFGANDTILFSSAYNDIAWLFFTDNHGRIKKFFDGNRLLFFDYESNSEFTIVDLSSDNIKHYSQSREKVFRSVSLSPNSSFFLNLNNAGFRDFMKGVGLSGANTIAGNFAQAINDVGKNPELHNQNFIIDGLSIAGDLVGMGASLFAEPLSLGWSTAGILTNAGLLLNDMNNLFNHIWPDYKQMNNYKDYYRNKYNITIKTISPENVKSNKADLRGSFMSLNGLKGNLNFTFSKLADTSTGNSIEGLAEPVTSNSYIVKGTATNLTPGTCYFYMLWYECEIDGLHFTYSSDNGMDFTTPMPEATTVGVESVEDKSAVIKCSFTNVPEGAICGVQYGNNDNSHVTTSASSDGERTINLSGLQPSTTYSYRAFIQYEGENYYGETKSFTTKDRELPDLSGTWTFNQSYLGSHTVYPNLKLSSSNSNSKSATYKASGFYGVISFSMTVASDGSASITLSSPYGQSGHFSGKFNDDFTSISGDSYIYDFGPDNWAVPPAEYEEPWSLSR